MLIKESSPSAECVSLRAKCFWRNGGQMQLNMSFLKDRFVLLHVKCALHYFLNSRRDA